MLKTAAGCAVPRNISCACHGKIVLSGKDSASSVLSRRVKLQRSGTTIGPTWNSRLQNSGAYRQSLGTSGKSYSMPCCLKAPRHTSDIQPSWIVRQRPDVLYACRSPLDLSQNPGGHRLSPCPGSISKTSTAGSFWDAEKTCISLAESLYHRPAAHSLFGCH